MTNISVWIPQKGDVWLTEDDTTEVIEMVSEKSVAFKRAGEIISIRRSRLRKLLIRNGMEVDWTKYPIKDWPESDKFKMSVKWVGGAVIEFRKTLRDKWETCPYTGGHLNPMHYYRWPKRNSLKYDLAFAATLGEKLADAKTPDEIDNMINELVGPTEKATEIAIRYLEHITKNVSSSDI